MSYKAGTYTASAAGRKGDVEVTVVFSEDAIESVEVGKNYETEVIASSPIRYIPQAIVDGQTLNVDAVAGATITSFAILNAVASCVEKAGGDASVLEAADAAPSTTAVTPGTYTAVADGHHSEVEVEVVLSGDAIEAVNILSEGETYNLSAAATGTVPQLIVDHQTVGVDAVTGATFTTRAIETAVERCIEQAGGVEAVRGFSKRVHTTVASNEERVIDCDVVVVGSGMTGVSAALAAQEAGAKTIIVEKLPYWGGASQTCYGTSQIPESQDPADIASYVEYGVQANCGIMRSEGIVDPDYPNRDILQVFAEGIEPAVSWLCGLADLPSYRLTVSIDDQPQWQRTMIGFGTGAHDLQTSEEEFVDLAPNVVGYCMGKLLDVFKERGGEIYLQAPMTEIMTDESGAVTGVKTDGVSGKFTVNAKAVVLAAGGFGNAPADRVARYAPAYVGEFSATLVGNTGDGIACAEEIGAEVKAGYMFGGNGNAPVHDSVIEGIRQVHPYYDPLIPPTTLWVNQMGLRTNSEWPVPYSTGECFVLPHEKDYYWAIFNHDIASVEGSMLDKFGTPIVATHSCPLQIIEEEIANGSDYYVAADTIEELANKIEIVPAILRYTLLRYNAMCQEGVDTDLSKPANYLVEMPLESGPWYAVKCEMVYFGTAGGVTSNEKAEVLTPEGAPIPGLYAAGESSNLGVYRMNYIAARALADCIVMGRIAGDNAGKLAVA
jgi:uncharacterized protein with FMN-binding domain/succinate dehydrogenase/fumarate reductase flavoprotein subunit